MKQKKRLNYFLKIKKNLVGGFFHYSNKYSLQHCNKNVKSVFFSKTFLKNIKNGHFKNFQKI